MPKDPLKQVTEAAQKQSVRAIEVLTLIMEDPLHSGNVRVSAANSILDRAFGKPSQQMDLLSSDGSMTPKGMDAFYAAMHVRASVDPEDDSLLH